MVTTSGRARAVPAAAHKRAAMPAATPAAMSAETGSGRAARGCPRSGSHHLLILEREPRSACQQQGLHYVYAQTCREKRCGECLVVRMER